MQLPQLILALLDDVCDPTRCTPFSGGPEDAMLRNFASTLNIDPIHVHMFKRPHAKSPKKINVEILVWT